MTSLAGLECNVPKYSFREILDMLVDQPDLILTIPTEYVDELKRGLAGRKSKDTYKQKKKGAITTKETIKYTVYPAKNETGDEIHGMSCVRVKVRAMAGIPVIDIKIPEEDELFSSLNPFKE